MVGGEECESPMQRRPGAAQRLALDSDARAANRAVAGQTAPAGTVTSQPMRGVTWRGMRAQPSLDPRLW